MLTNPAWLGTSALPDCPARGRLLIHNPIFHNLYRPSCGFQSPSCPGTQAVSGCPTRNIPRHRSPYFRECGFFGSTPPYQSVMVNPVFASCSDDLAAFDQTPHLTFESESTLAFSWAVTWQWSVVTFSSCLVLTLSMASVTSERIKSRW